MGKRHHSRDFFVVQCRLPVIIIKPQHGFMQIFRKRFFCSWLCSVFLLLLSVESHLMQFSITLKMIVSFSR